MAAKAAAMVPALLIPALNEEAVIASTLQRVPVGLFAHVIVADNGSQDRTRALALAHGAIVTVEPARGYGATCLRGLRALPSEVDAVVFMQADGSEDPREAELLLQPLRNGEADLVIGSRTLGAVDAGALLPHQRFGNWLALTLIRWLYGFRYTDLGPFRAIRRDALQRIGMRDMGYGWTVEMQVLALQHRLRVIEVPVSYSMRRAGINKISGNWKASFRAGITIIGTIFSIRFGQRLRR